ncbi:MAG: PhzF family phenazine biosynthesis protein [Balneolales bacterium]
MSNTFKINQVDAFTRKPYNGNPAGVVLDADHLNAKDMQKIANEMNLAETAFVLKPTSEENDLKIRWFSPTQEVSLCGHATIAAFHVLAEEGHFGLEIDEPQSFMMETKSGELAVDLDWKDMRPFIRFSLPLPQFFPFPDDITTLCGALGLSEIELSSKVKPQITGDGFCYVALKDYDSLKTLEPNFHLLRKFYDRHNICGFAVVTTDIGNKDNDWHMRFFAPALGINEDIVTGSANGAMAVFLLENGFLDEKKGFHSFKGTQGRFVNRTGYVTVIMTVKDGKPEDLQICGEAVTVMKGTMKLNVNIPEKF